VTQGLDGSETVITTGSYGLDDGTKVKVGKAAEDEKQDDDKNKKRGDKEDEEKKDGSKTGGEAK
jgi:HlyD family secretion protein